MNRLGIMVDVSHVTDEVINQVMDMTDVPVIASHSSCRYFTKGWERNMFLSHPFVKYRQDECEAITGTSVISIT